MVGEVLTSGPLVIASAVIAVLIGILFCFFGYRLFKIVLGIAGFIWGALLVASVVFGLTHSTLAAVLAGLAGGIVFALLAVFLYYVGVFILGTFFGAAIGIFVLAIVGVMTPVWVILILAVLGGVLAVIFQRFMIILSTAFVGAWAVVFGVFHLIPKTEGVAYTYIALVAWIVLGVIGMLVQYRVTARKKLEEDRRKAA
jgi:hypothetical protein